MPRGKRGTRQKADKEVPVRGKGLAYAASDTIARGTAARVASDMGREKSICLCGCGLETSGGAFKPGHDSKARAQGKAVLDGRIKKSDLKPETRKYLDEGGFWDNAQSNEARS